MGTASPATLRKAGAPTDAAKDFAVCFSLANLCFLNAWHDLPKFQSEYLNYFRSTPPSGILLATTLCNVMLLTGAFWLALVLVRRTANAMVARIADAIFLILLLVPLNHLQGYLLATYGHTTAVLVARIGLATLAGLSVAGAVLSVVFQNRAIVQVAIAAVLVMVFYFPVTLIEGTWFILRSPPASAFADQPTARPLALRPPGSLRIVWLLFDELDERLAFLRRPAGIQLPEFDRFRNEALYAMNARSPANSTSYTIPALVTGKLVSQITSELPDELLITFKDSSETASWETQPNVFSRAREMGIDTAVAGWHHPYCRVMNTSLTSCFWVAGVDISDMVRREEYARRFGFWKSMEAQAGRQLAAFPPLSPLSRGMGETFQMMRQVHLENYVRLREKALELVANPRYGLIFVHWPIPHPPGIYERSRQQLSLNSSNDYLDNLLLSDQALGEVRRAIEGSGTAHSTAILVTSDHPLRPHLWSTRPTWTQEMADLTGDVEFPAIPFLLKLPGQKEGLIYKPEFNTIVTHDLFLALFRGELTTPEQAAHWLDQNRSRFPTE